jgi:uncharacterized repeat protein (TIGR01451 family)
MKLRIGVVLLICLISHAVVVGQGSGELRGLRLNCDGATQGYTLFAPMTSDTTYLVDLDGKAIRTWKSAYLPSAWVYFLDNGHILRGGSDRGPSPFGGGGQGGRFQEFDFNGNLVWDFQYNQTRLPHHDIAVLPNGNILAIAWEGKSAQEARRAGRREASIPASGIWPDMVIEFEPQGSTGARIVWEWHIWDHLIQNLDPALDNYGDPAAHPERININGDTGGAAFSRDVFHTNAIDYNPELDQVLLSIPTFNEVWVIDHSTTTQEAAARTGGRSGNGGDLLYRWGNPRAYGRGTSTDQLLGFQHDARWIPQGRPGAGHMMVYSNQTPTPTGSTTKIYELVPPIDADGRYTISATRPFGPGAPLWTYSNESLQTTNLSGAERLQNGNTLISSGPQGRLFEVTPAGDIVWEYWSPYSGSFNNNSGAFSLFRAVKIPQNHPGLNGQTLRALDPQPGVPSFASVAKEPDNGNCHISVPTLIAIEPSTLGQGTSVEVTLTGTNFVQGLTLSGSDLTVSDVQVVNPTTATATLTVAPSASVGPAEVTVTTSAGTSTPVAFNIVEPFPDLSIRSLHTGNFGVGFEESYTVTVSNIGSVPTTGAIVLTDSLPAGLSFVSGNGAGWTCSAIDQNVTCTNSTAMASNDSTSCTMTVAVDVAAAAQVNHFVSVTGDGDLNVRNNSTSETIAVIKPSPVFVFNPYPLRAGEPATVGVTMPAPFPHDVTGSIDLRFDSNAVIPIDDPAIQFSGGGRKATFRIPANETEARFGSESLPGPLAFQSGTVAGILTFAGSLTAGKVEQSFSPVTLDGLTIPLRGLSIQGVRTSTQGGFTVSLLLFSTAREVTQLSLSFNTSPRVQLSCGTTAGCSVSGNALMLDVSTLFSGWFRRDSLFGGLAQLQLPLSIQGGVVKGTVAVTLKNSQGESNSQSFSLP